MLAKLFNEEWQQLLVASEQPIVHEEEAPAGKWVACRVRDCKAWPSSTNMCENQRTRDLGAGVSQGALKHYI